MSAEPTPDARRQIFWQISNWAKELGLCVAVWTVNDAKDINAMIDSHVDAIVTDYPGRVQRQLSDRGWLWAR